ncbi:anti-sigma-D factor RsdA [Actinokineospora sp.]|uniref:anti-sigma-D factor RsdA n=1 Tax=Actinokineospora sp. TaxID=1872133 RepID=UPI003D6A56B3
MSDQGKYDRRRDDEAELTLPSSENADNTTVVPVDFGSGVRFGDDFDLTGPGRDPFGRLGASDFDDDAIDFSLVHADDAFLDALGGAIRGEVPDETSVRDDELAALLSSWRDDVDAEPIKELVDTKYAVATVIAAKARNRRRPRLLVPFAAAAAVLAIAFTGAGLAAKDAQPGDTLWGLTRVLYADHARSVEAAASVRQDLSIAQTALAQGKLAEAKDKLDEAQKGLPSVSSEDGQADLAALHSNLVSQLPGSPANEAAPPPSANPTTAAPSSVVPTTTPTTPEPSSPSSPPSTTPSAPTSTTEPTTTSATAPQTEPRSDPATTDGGSIPNAGPGTQAEPPLATP